MSSEIRKESITSGKKLYEISAKQNTETEITLPDYCQDIKKILRCTLVPGIHTVSLSGERAAAKGTGIIRIVYLAEGDKTDVFEKSCDLFSDVQMKDVPSDGVLNAVSMVDFVNCRATSQRKMSVSAGVTTVFTCFSKEKQEYIDSCEKSVQTRKEKLTGENLLGYYEKTFDMNETVALNSEHAAVGKILTHNGRCNLASHKLSSGKLLVKGELLTQMCYLEEKSDNKISILDHSMPISQIIDVRELPDGTLCDIELQVRQLLLTVKADSSGGNRLVEISARVSAFVKATEKKECEVITDCYCLDCESEEKFEKPGFVCCVREIDEKRQEKSIVEFSSPVSEICYVSCNSVTSRAGISKDEAEFSCSALLSIIFRDEKGCLGYCEKNADFSFSYSVVKKCENPFADFRIEPCSVTCHRSEGDKAEVVLEFNVKGKICCSFEKKILTQVHIFRDKPKKGKAAALTVYFPDEDESLWDIAKLHSTTVESIMQENGLEKEKLSGKQMLLIPCV